MEQAMVRALFIGAVFYQNLEFTRLWDALASGPDPRPAATLLHRNAFLPRKARPLPTKKKLLPPW